MFHESSMGKHFIHSHLLIVTVLPDCFLGYFDSVHHAIQSVSSLLDNPKLSASNLCQLKKFLLIPKSFKVKVVIMSFDTSYNTL